MSALFGNQKIIFFKFFCLELGPPGLCSPCPPGHPVATSLLRGDAKAIKYSRMFNSFGDALWPALWLIPVVDEVSPRGRRDDMPPRRWQFDGSVSAAYLRPSADGSAVRTSLMAGGG